MAKITQDVQIVFVELSDGESAAFLGPAICAPGDERSIKNISFSAPMSLPKGCELTSLGEIQSQSEMN